MDRLKRFFKFPGSGRDLQNNRNCYVFLMSSYLLLSFLTFLFCNPFSLTSVQRYFLLPDGSYYVKSALHLLTGFSFDPRVYTSDYCFPPLYPIAIYGTLRVFGSIGYLIVIQYLATVATVLMVSNRLGKYLGYYPNVFLFLFLFNPMIFPLPFYVNTELPAVLVLCFSFLAFMHYRIRRSFSAIVVAVSLLAFINYFRITTLAILPLILAGIYIFEKEIGLRKIVYLALAVVLVLSPQYARNYYYYGSVSFSGTFVSNSYLLFYRPVLEKIKSPEAQQVMARQDSMIRRYDQARDVREFNIYNSHFDSANYSLPVKYPAAFASAVVKNMLKSQAGFSLEFFRIYLFKTQSDYLGFGRKMRMETFLDPGAMTVIVWNLIHWGVVLLCCVTFFGKMKTAGNIKHLLTSHYCELLMLLYVLVLSSVSGAGRFKLPFLVFIYSMISLWNFGDEKQRGVS